MIDLHSHILPGIDDGAAMMQDSIRLVKELESIGVSDIFATPHYVDETIYVSPRKDNLKLIDELQREIDKEGISVRLHLGNEVYITPRILQLVSEGEISTLGDTKNILVELPMSGEFPGYRDIMLELIRSGYHVILAHPERYSAFMSDYSLILDLHEMGVDFQCNLGSFAGQYGRGVFKLARRLAKEKMIWGMGSDIHHVHPGLLENGKKKLARFYTEDELNEILVNNPKKILLAESDAD